MNIMVNIVKLLFLFHQ